MLWCPAHGVSSLIAPVSSTWPAGVGSPSSTARCWPTPTRRSRPTPSWGAGRTRSCSRAWSAARSGRPTASWACGRAPWCARAATAVEVLQPDDDGGVRVAERVDGRRAAALPGRLPGRADARGAARAAALLRRRGRLARLRHRAQLRAAAQRASPTTWGCPSSASPSPTRSSIFDNLRGTREGRGGGRRRRRAPSRAARTTTPARASRRCSTRWRGPAPPLRPLDPDAGGGGRRAAARP